MILHRVFDARRGASARRHAHLFVKASLLGMIALFAFSCRQGAGSQTAAQPVSGLSSKNHVVTPIPFGELNDGEAYNASGVVPLDDSRFLLCDNHVSDALYELDLTSDGQKPGKLIRRPLQGLGEDSVDDLESMTLAEEGGRKFLFVASSLCLKKGRQSMQEKPTNVAANGLLRVTVNPDHGLSAENMPGFRNWLIQHEPELAPAATRVANEGGLNIEGLAWDHNRGALLFGVRTPAPEGKSMVIPIKVKNYTGSWTTDNLEALPPIWLTPEPAEGPQGIRSLEYIAPLNTFLVVTGNTVEDSKAPFTLYEWDGQTAGAMRRVPLTFAAKMKPEGMTAGTIGGKPALLFVDDAGGFQAVGLDMIHP
jgi:hypothetical protein